LRQDIIGRERKLSPSLEDTSFQREELGELSGVPFLKFELNIGADVGAS